MSCFLPTSIINLTLEQNSVIIFTELYVLYCIWNFEDSIGLKIIIKFVSIIDFDFDFEHLELCFYMPSFNVTMIVILL